MLNHRKAEVPQGSRFVWLYGEYRVELANGVRIAARLEKYPADVPYNPDSEFVGDRAREGDAIVPFVLELSRAPDGPSKWNANALIGALFVSQKAGTLAVPLSASSAVRAVMPAEDKAALPLLEQLAKSDPDADPAWDSVRSLAAEALRRLR